MASNHYSEIVVVCEDRQQEIFARTFLTRYFNIEYPEYRIIIKIAPKGQGSGKQFVEKTFIDEIRIYRRKRFKKKIALVVMLDSDTTKVTATRQYLEKLLADADVPPPQEGERIAIFIPKRNIETWIYFLMGQPVNEQKAYPHLESESLCRPYVDQLAQNCANHIPLPQTMPDSLKKACEELLRLPK